MSTPPDRLQPSPRRGVAVVVVQDARLLVICRSASVAAPGMYCFPGGHIEPGESEAAAVEREMIEELGAVVRPIRLLWRSTTPWRVELAWWLAELAESSELAANAAEVESIHWLTAEEILALPGLLDSNRHFLDALQRGEFALEKRWPE